MAACLDKLLVRFLRQTSASTEQDVERLDLSDWTLQAELDEEALELAEEISEVLEEQWVVVDKPNPGWATPNYS